MKIIAIANQKGGVAKTTTTSALAYGLAEKGKKVLMIDLDPQGNLSDACGAEQYEDLTIYDVLKDSTVINDAIQSIGGVDVIASNIMLSSAEQEINQTGKEYRLKEAIEQIKKKYDYIIIDTPPALSLLTVNAFTAADEVIIPTNAGIFAVNGIQQLHKTICGVQKYCNKDLKIKGILITKYNPRANINKDLKELTENLAKYISAPVFKTYIRASVVVEESQANKLPIYEMKKSTVAEDYKNFVDEFLSTK